MSDLVPFFRLYRRVSKRTEREYVVGRVGMVKVIGFPGEADDGTPTLEIFLAAGDQQQRPATAAPPARRTAPRPQPDGHRRPIAGKAAAAGEGAEPEPFNDALDHIGSFRP